MQRMPARAAAAARTTACAAVLALLLAACGSTDTGQSTAGQGGGGGDGAEASGTGEQSQWFVQADYDRSREQMQATPEGPADQPWLQAIEPEMADTSKLAKPGPAHLCFSNAGLSNGWRQVGFKTMQQEVEVQKQAGTVGTFTVVDAGDRDDKQISDIETLLGQDCDALIISPATTEALTPAVEQACQSGIPVVVFDRGVNTDCMTSFVHPIGGYAFGITAAEFLAENVKEGGNVLALRILPGVDVLETRWAAAKEIFDERGINVVGVEFSDGDPAKSKSITSDYIQRFGSIDGVWMDAGDTAVPVIEAFEDAGMEVPPITGEDRQDFLVKWKEDSLTAVAPTYPTFQWRTAVIAAVNILGGKEVPKEWVLPQPTITEDNLDQYLDPQMPPQFYALCGCQDLPGFPDVYTD